MATTKYASTAFLQGGLSYLKSSVASVRLLSNFTAGDPPATITANQLVNLAITAAAITLNTPAAGAAATATFAPPAAQNAGATGGGANNTIAFCDSTGAAIWCTPETSQQTVTIGNPVTFPTLVYTASQPA
jgi:hypothetical protein